MPQTKIGEQILILDKEVLPLMDIWLQVEQQFGILETSKEKKLL
jgi:hypothetical protein